MADDKPIELSLIIPCLNEGETLGVCISKAHETLSALNISYEIILADNGSVDGSQMIARRLDARVVHVQARGYGCTVMAGVESSNGKYIVLVDADNRYDLRELERFINALRDGADLVQGCRLSAGGGNIHQGAMRWINRRFAIPFFSLLARRWFGSRVRDIFCGMRGFSRRAYDSWSLRCIGLEFGMEMIIRASLHRDRVEEVPVSYLPDTRKMHQPHLKNFNDGWRALRLLLISCPKWLFLIPGGIAILLGLIGYYFGYTNARMFGVQFDINTILLASLSIILGYQAVLFAGFTLLFAINERFLPHNPRVIWMCRRINMERGLFFGLSVLFIGIGFIVSAWLLWRANNYGGMDYQMAMRRVIPGVTMTAVGFQTILSGAFMSILGMYRRAGQIQAPMQGVAEKPWLSVIMPTYQGGHHLDSALSSIAMQNDGGIEVIMIDDGSTDSVKEVVQAWGNAISLRVVWRNRVGNWVSNTNLGLSEAKGEWVCLLHQDDMWCQGRIGIMRDMIRKHPEVGMFFHPVNFINDKGSRIGRWKAPLPGRVALNPDYVLPRLITQDFIAIMAPVFKKSLMDEVGLMDEDLWYHADWDYWLRLAAAGPVVYCPEILASFRLHDLSQTSQRTSNLDDVGSQIDAVVERALANKAFPLGELKDARKITVFHRALYLHMLAVVHKKTSSKLDLLREAIKLGPLGLIRYVHRSRLIERTLPRIRRAVRDN